jgi:hypothetical protein
MKNLESTKTQTPSPPEAGPKFTLGQIDFFVGLVPQGKIFVEIGF